MHRVLFAELTAPPAGAVPLRVIFVQLLRAPIFLLSQPLPVPPVFSQPLTFPLSQPLPVPPVFSQLQTFPLSQPLPVPPVFSQPLTFPLSQPLPVPPVFSQLQTFPLSQPLPVPPVFSQPLTFLLSQPLPVIIASSSQALLVLTFLSLGLFRFQISSFQRLGAAALGPHHNLALYLTLLLLMLP
jgi:hypothetical protein